MKKEALIVLVLGLILASAAAAPADGDIYVGSPWGTRITSLPYEIKTPGSYYLGGDLSYAGTSHGITISSNHVTLDLMGFSLKYTGASSPYGISMNGRTNVEIRNGTVTGFLVGIKESGSGLAHRIINVRAVGNGTGISLSGTGHLVKGCEAIVPGNLNSIYLEKGGIVTGCTVGYANGEFGGINIGYGLVSGNVITGTSNVYTGIGTVNPGLVIRDNNVSGCGHGIGCKTGATVIGNTVNTVSGTTGISMIDDSSNVLDQNTVTGAGTHYNATYSNVQKRNNY
jgi:hypothetical protein